MTKVKAITPFVKGSVGFNVGDELELEHDIAIKFQDYKYVVILDEPIIEEKAKKKTKSKKVSE